MPGFLEHSAVRRPDNPVAAGSRLAPLHGAWNGAPGSGGIAALNPRLRSGIPSGCKTRTAHGELQFALPDVLKLPPISTHGNVNEIVAKFGGADQLRAAVHQLQALLYVA